MNIKKIIFGLMLLVTSLQASTPYVDYWETLQEENGRLTIDTIWKKSQVLSNIHFLISEDQSNGSPILLTVLNQWVGIIEDEEWASGDSVVFRPLGEEYYYVTNLRTNTTVIAKETWNVVF